MDHQKTTSIKIKAYLRKVHCANCKVISGPSVSVADSDDDDNVNNNIIQQKWMHGISLQSKQTPPSTKSKCAQASADRVCLLLKMILTTTLAMTL